MTTSAKTAANVQNMNHHSLAISDAAGPAGCKADCPGSQAQPATIETAAGTRRRDLWAEMQDTISLLHPTEGLGDEHECDNALEVLFRQAARVTRHGDACWRMEYVV